MQPRDEVRTILLSPLRRRETAKETRSLAEHTVNAPCEAIHALALPLQMGRVMRGICLWLVVFVSACAFTDDEGIVDGASVSSETYLLSGPANESVGAGRMHSCALTDSGGVQCWGDGGYGQLGNGSLADSNEAVDVSGITDAVAVTAGWYHACALRSDATVACWGYNLHGQLGNGTNTTSATPVAVAGLSDVVSVSAGGFHTCAVNGTGNVKCWGYNGYGALGDGTTARSNTPRTVGFPFNFMGNTYFIAETDVADVDAGHFHTCARRSSGLVRCWGRNHAGQLGDGTTSNRYNPVTVHTINTAIDVSAGQSHSCAVTNDGSAWCWGYNASGQLADASTTNRTTPVQGAWFSALGDNYPLYGVRSVSADGSHTCVTHVSEAMWCAGDNSFGQHGTEMSNTFFLRHTPVNAVEVSAGPFHTCVRTPAGNLRCVGRNTWGQLGGFHGCSDQRTVSITSVTAPFGEILTKGSINYLTGDAADITLSVDECESIDSVKLVGLSLGTTPGPDGGSRYYEVVNQTYPGDGTKLLRVRIHFTNGENGTTFPAEVSLSSPADSTPISVETLLVGVMRVGGSAGTIMLSENEIRNEVIGAMFEKFGNGNHWDRGDKYPDFYDLDYDSLEVRLTSAGIYFKGTAVARILGDFDVCDPTVTVDGTFKVIVEPVQGRSITIQWVDGPNPDTNFPFFCDAVSLELLQVAAEIVDWASDDNVASRIQKRIRELGAVCEEPLGCDWAVKTIDHHDGDFEIVLEDLFNEVIAIRNVYDTDAIEDFNSVGDPMVRGMAIPANEHLMFSTTGLVDTCSIPTWDCTDDTRTVAGTGVFNYNVNPPVPTPWPECGNPICPIYTGHVEPWFALLGAQRDAAELPLPDHSVGALVGRTFSRVNGQLVERTPFNAGDHLCVMKALSTPDTRLVLGRNDINAPTGAFGNGEYGAGEAIITIGFAVPYVATILDECQP